MKSSRDGNAVVILLAIVMIGGLLAAGIYFLAPNPGTTSQQAAPQQQDSSLSIGESRPAGDINDDGVVTQVDAQLVRAQIGCTSADACWNEVIGKTLSGDNPIYTSDLDMDSDGSITENDAIEVTKNIVGGSR